MTLNLNGTIFFSAGAIIFRPEIIILGEQVHVAVARLAFVVLFKLISEEQL